MKLIHLFILCTIFTNFTFADIDAFEAARNGDIALMEKLHKANPDTINSMNSQGYSVLILATYYNQIDMVKYLIKKKVDLISDKGSSTALQACSYKGFKEIAKALLDYGADPNIHDANGITPLLYACQFQHIEIVSMLKHAGANLDYKDQSGRTAMDYCKLLGYDEILAILND